MALTSSSTRQPLNSKLWSFVSLCDFAALPHSLAIRSSNLIHKMYTCKFDWAHSSHRIVISMHNFHQFLAQQIQQRTAKYSEVCLYKMNKAVCSAEWTTLRAWNLCVSPSIDTSCHVLPWCFSVIYSANASRFCGGMEILYFWWSLRSQTSNERMIDY